MPIFQGFFLEDNNDKESEFFMGQKVNSKKKEKQEISISYKSQKVNARVEEYLTFKA